MILKLILCYTMKDGEYGIVCVLNAYTSYNPVLCIICYSKWYTPKINMIE